MEIVRVSRLLGWLLLPVVLLVAATIALYVLGVSVGRDSATLLTAFNVLFCSAPGFVVAFLGARSYLLTRSRSVLLLGAGGLALALAYLLAGPLITAPNGGITVHNSSMVVASAILIGSAVVALSPRASSDAPSAPVWGLIAPYFGGVLLVAVITIATLADIAPDFYVVGEGMTPVRDSVLGIAVVGFFAAAVLFAAVMRRSGSRMHAYVAAGLVAFGVSLAVLALTRATPGSPIVWLGRSGQWLGGFYLLVGVFTLDRSTGEWASSLERALSAVEDRYQKLVELSPYGIVVQLDGHCVFVNQALATILGVQSKSELVGRSVLDWVWPDHRDHMACCLDPEAGEALHSPHEIGLIRSDGTLLAAEVACAIIEFGGRRAVQVIVGDVTLRREAEAAMRESEERFRTLVEGAPLGIFIQTGGRFAYLNRAAEELFGVERQGSLLDEPVLERIHPDQREAVRERVRFLSEDQGEVPMLEETILRIDGTTVDVEVFAIPFSYRGDDRGALVFMSDVTERKKATQEATRLNRILEDSLNEIYVFDAESLRFTQVNHGARKNLGYDLDELLAMTPLDIKPKLDRDTFRSILESLRCGREEVAVFAAEHRRKDGSTYPVEVHLQLADSGGQPVFVAVILDVTDRRRAEEALAISEEQLRQSQKMEAVGQLAGGVAHDFNNLLTAIVGYSDLVLARGDEVDADARADVTEIRRAAERAAVLTKQILAFSRKQALRPAVVCLNDILVDMEPLLRRTLGEDIDLLTLRYSELGLTEIDVHQLEQVLINLAVNARDAMPRGGRLTLETANVEIDDEYCRSHPEATVGSCVMLGVSDNGSGMDAETKSHVFEPFFTTKPPGAGTGLGLSTVYGIVRQSGGHVFVYSELGRGTTFKIYLPRVFADKDAVQADAPAESRPVAGERILVVEDEVALRNLIMRVLSDLGYEVLSAGSGDEALELVSELARRPDMLLTDVVLPGGVQGNHLAQRLSSRWPDMPVLYMSGYTRNAIVHSGRLDEGVNFLEKPFTPGALARMVGRILEHPTL